MFVLILINYNKIIKSWIPEIHLFPLTQPIFNIFYFGFLNSALTTNYSSKSEKEAKYIIQKMTTCFPSLPISHHLDRVAVLRGDPVQVVGYLRVDPQGVPPSTAQPPAREGVHSIHLFKGKPVLYFKGVLI